MRDIVQRETPASVSIRPAHADDHEAIGRILAPVVRAGEVFALPRDWSGHDAADYWLSPAHSVFVAEAEGRVAGAYYLRPNQLGGGAHVANAGYVTDPALTGRGVARALCAHSLDEARRQGFRAMQFNFVVATNERAVALWKAFGFEVAGRLPGAFEHPRLGGVDALVMFRRL